VTDVKQGNIFTAVPGRQTDVMHNRFKNRSLLKSCL